MELHSSIYCMKHAAFIKFLLATPSFLRKIIPFDGSNIPWIICLHDLTDDFPDTSKLLIKDKGIW